MAQIIDYTKLKVNKKERLVECPDCGKVGQLRSYKEGDAVIIHKAHIELGCFLNINEACLFKNWKER